jgi:hypothetical protein
MYGQLRTKMLYVFILGLFIFVCSSDCASLESTQLDTAALEATAPDPTVDAQEAAYQAINNIRSVANMPELPLEFVEMTSMINSPDGSLPVALYQDSQGRKFMVEPLTSKVVEIDARALLTSNTLGAAELSQEELRAKAEELVEASGADLNILYREFRYEESVKAMHFFDWRHAGSPEWYNPPFVQVGLHVSGELIGYLNTLGFE